MNSFPRASQMRHEYRMRGVPRYLLLGMGILFACLAVVVVNNSLPSSPTNLFSLLMPVFFFFAAACMVAWPLRARLILNGTQIEVRSLFSERFADLNEIEGYRTIQTRNGSYTKLYLKQGQRAITVSNSFTTDDDYRAWLQQIPDLDKRDRDAILEEISHEQELGATPEERLGKLANAKTWGIFITVISGAAAVALVFGESILRVPSFVLLTVTPVAAFFFLQRSPLLFAVFKQKADPRAELSYPLIVSGFGLLLSCTRLHFVSFEGLLPVIVPVSLAHFFAFFAASQKASARLGRIPALLFFAGFFGVGFGMLADTISDTAPATTYSADVIGKHISRGRSTSYYLELAPWGPKSTTNGVSVSPNDYRNFGIGDQVCLSLHPGSLHAPWYQLVDCTDRFSPDLNR
jgi:hypothetical protein